MEIKYHQEKGIDILHFSGSLNMTAMGINRDDILDYIKNASKAVIFDCKEVSAIDSSGIGDLKCFSKSLK